MNNQYSYSRNKLLEELKKALDIPQEVLSRMKGEDDPLAKAKELLEEFENNVRRDYRKTITRAITQALGEQVATMFQPIIDKFLKNMEPSRQISYPVPFPTIGKAILSEHSKKILDRMVNEQTDKK